MLNTPNNIFKNWYKECYIRPRLEPILDDYGNEIPQYGDYKLYRFNYQPVSDEAEMKAYGITNTGTVKAIVDRKYLNEIHEFDLVYLNGASPVDEQFTGEKANFRVITFFQQNTKILVYFERITNSK